MTEGVDAGRGMLIALPVEPELGHTCEIEATIRQEPFASWRKRPHEHGKFPGVECLDILCFSAPPAVWS